MLTRWQVGLKTLTGKRLFFLLAVASVFYFSFLWRLRSLVPGLSAAEKTSIDFSSSFSNIWHNPLNLPYHLVQNLFLRLNIGQVAAGRLTSVVFMALFTACLYITLKHWFGRTAAIFGALLFSTNPYAIIVGRGAVPLILLFSPAAIIAAFSWVLQADKKLKLAWACACAVLALSLYAPGVIWVSVAGIFIGRREITRVFRILPKKFTYATLTLGIFILSPLVYALASGNISLRTYFLLPQHLAGMLALGKSLLWTLSSFFAKTATHTDYILGQSPMLDITEVALVVMGGYALAARLKRTAYVPLAATAVVVLLATINQSTTALYLVLPLLLTLAAVGMRFLYLEWRSVFPFNPLPKYLAFTLVSLVLVMHVAYGLRYALVAWPHNTATRSVYMLK